MFLALERENFDLAHERKREIPTYVNDMAWHKAISLTVFSQHGKIKSVKSNS